MNIDSYPSDELGSYLEHRYRTAEYWLGKHLKLLKKFGHEDKAAGCAIAAVAFTHQGKNRIDILDTSLASTLLGKWPISPADIRNVQFNTANKFAQSPDYKATLYESLYLTNFQAIVQPTESMWVAYTSRNSQDSTTGHVLGAIHIGQDKWAVADTRYIRNKLELIPSVVTTEGLYDEVMSSAKINTDIHTYTFRPFK